MKIFVSYSRADKASVLDIVQALKIHDVWIDDRLNVGQEWWDEIERQIAASHCFMYVLSPESLASEYCQKEWAVARRLGKPIAPVLLKACTVPQELSRLQIIDVSGGLTPHTTSSLLNGLFEIERVVSNPLRRDQHGKSETHGRKLAIADLTFVTRSEHKKLRYEQTLGVKLNVNPIPLDVIQKVDPAEVAVHKVQQAHQILRRPVFVEQSALAIRAWGGLPGGMTRAFVEAVGMLNLCKMLDGFEDRYAEGIAVIAFTDGEMVRKFVGVLPGRIAERPRGTGYGWNTIFIPQGFDKTFAELTDDEIQSISMRRPAIFEFMRFLKDTYDME
jgi:inosine triphosphate pyrophosphatase